MLIGTRLTHVPKPFAKGIGSKRPYPLVPPFFGGVYFFFSRQGIVQQLLECVALMLGRKRFEGQPEP